MTVYIITVFDREARFEHQGVIAVYTDEAKAKKEFAKYPTNDCDSYYELNTWETK